SGARAQLAMTWDAPAGCPDRAALLDEISELAPDAVARGPIDARVSEDGERWRATVASIDGARELEGNSCATVTSAVALVVATAMVVPRAPATSAETITRVAPLRDPAPRHASEERAEPASATQ